MTIEFFKRLGWFFVYLLAQVVVLGNIHLFGVATPLVYVYFILQLPYGYTKWGSLLWGFLLGLSVDIFFNTPGVAAASLTIIAALQPYYYQMFVSRDSLENLVPGLRTIGMVKFSYYVIPMVLIYCALFFTLEQFSFFHLFHWLQCVVGSALMTLVLIYTLEIAKKRNP